MTGTIWSPRCSSTDILGLVSSIGSGCTCVKSNREPVGVLSALSRPLSVMLAILSCRMSDTLLVLPCRLFDKLIVLPCRLSGPWLLGREGDGDLGDFGFFGRPVLAV